MDQKAELIVRLEEIMETDYTSLDIVKVEADLKVLALSVLVLLRGEERPVFQDKHFFAGCFCVNCGKSRFEIAADGSRECEQV